MYVKVYYLSCKINKTALIFMFSLLRALHSISYLDGDHSLVYTSFFQSSYLNRVQMLSVGKVKILAQLFPDCFLFYLGEKLMKCWVFL